MKGLVWSSASLGVLLADGNWRHDPHFADAEAGAATGREEVYACCELLQALGAAFVFRRA